MEKFWAADDNKVKFQNFAKGYLIDLAKKVNQELIVSGTLEGEISMPALYLNNHLDVNTVDALEYPYEEADMRIIPHIYWDVRQFSRKCLTVMSGDTDVFILLLYYFHVYQECGLLDIFVRTGEHPSKYEELFSCLPLHKGSQEHQLYSHLNGCLNTVQALIFFLPVFH